MNNSSKLSIKLFHFLSNHHSYLYFISLVFFVLFIKCIYLRIVIALVDVSLYFVRFILIFFLLQ